MVASTPIVSPRTRKAVGFAVAVIGLLGWSLFDVLDWLGTAGPWVILGLAFSIAYWDNVAAWLRHPWRVRPLTRRRLKRETLALVRDMYDVAKERPPWTSELAEHHEMSRAMQSAKSEHEKRETWHTYTQKLTERSATERVHNFERFGGQLMFVLDAFEARGMLEHRDRSLLEWQVGSTGWLPDAARRLDSLARRL